ncbi:MAG: DJ-1/PfpI family protein [Clostridia bacterium]|nr:DJ-1/PfpI family protein [Clostridia bacterium]
MVYMFLANGFEEVEALCPLDLLRRAGVEVKTVAVGAPDLRVTGSHGITVVADMAESEFADAAPEMIILPGGMPGSTNLDKSAAVDAALQAAVASDGYLAAICAAPMVLGKRGLLSGKRAICFPGFEEYLQGATVAEEKVVCDGKCITAAGMGVALPFGLALVSALRGKEAASALHRAVLAD